MKKRAMSSLDASIKKRAGHTNEYHFAELIGGQVQRGSHIEKKDVRDQRYGSRHGKGSQGSGLRYAPERF